jgi:hypothetical protein
LRVGGAWWWRGEGGWRVVVEGSHMADDKSCSRQQEQRQQKQLPVAAPIGMDMCTA